MEKDSTEKEYLRQYNIHDYPVPLTTVDIAIFRIHAQQLQVLLVRRVEHPALGKQALPGGFVDLRQDRNLLETAQRKLLEKTGVRVSYLEQVATYGDAERDPRGWSVTVVYMALIDTSQQGGEPAGADTYASWQPVTRVLEKMELAFDHNAILVDCLQRLRSRVQYTSLPVNLLPEKFTLAELQRIFEIILEKPLEKKAFRRRMLASGVLADTGEMHAAGGRPARLYRATDSGSSHVFSRVLEGSRTE